MFLLQVLSRVGRCIPILERHCGPLHELLIKLPTPYRLQCLLLTDGADGRNHAAHAPGELDMACLSICLGLGCDWIFRLLARPSLLFLASLDEGEGVRLVDVRGGIARRILATRDISDIRVVLLPHNIVGFGNFCCGNNPFRWVTSHTGRRFGSRGGAVRQRG